MSWRRKLRVYLTYKNADFSHVTRQYFWHLECHGPIFNNIEHVNTDSVQLSKEMVDVKSDTFPSLW